MSEDEPPLKALREWNKRNRLSAVGAHEFRWVVPPIFGSKSRTRILIALSVNGPGTGADLYKTVCEADRTNLNSTLRLLIESGVVAARPYGARSAFYINDAHPAWIELQALCKHLAVQWQPPKWPDRRPRKVASSMPEPTPCNLFGLEATTRFFLLSSATGGAPLGAGSRLLGLTNRSWLGTAMERFVRIGMVKRWESTWPNAVKANISATLYALDEDFFAYKSLRWFVGKLIRRVHPEIMGYAQILGKRGMQMLPEQSQKILRLPSRRSKDPL